LFWLFWVSSISANGKFMVLPYLVPIKLDVDDTFDSGVEDRDNNTGGVVTDDGAVTNDGTNTDTGVDKIDGVLDNNDGAVIECAVTEDGVLDNNDVFVDIFDTGGVGGVGGADI
jgi:hypothetical protein